MQRTKEAKRYWQQRYPEEWYMCEVEPEYYVQEMKLGGLF